MSKGLAEGSLELLLSQSKCDETESYVNLSMSPEEYRRLADGVKQLAARDAQLAEAKAEIEKLREAVRDNDEFMAYMTEELGRLACCHESGEHKNTPPMFWPELIRCIIARAVRDSKAAPSAPPVERPERPVMLLGKIRVGNVSVEEDWFRFVGGDDDSHKWQDSFGAVWPASGFVSIDEQHSDPAAVEIWKRDQKP